MIIRSSALERLTCKGGRYLIHALRARGKRYGTGTPEDDAVADLLADRTVELCNRTARRNREVFIELFRLVPTNLVCSWSVYEVTTISLNLLHACLIYVPKVKTGHVVPEVGLPRIKEHLLQIRGSVVESLLVGCFLSWQEIGAHISPRIFLIDDKEFVDGIDWPVGSVQPHASDLHLTTVVLSRLRVAAGKLTYRGFIPKFVNIY
jgi:hypothetical protein